MKRPKFIKKNNNELTYVCMCIFNAAYVNINTHTCLFVHSSKYICTGIFVCDCAINNTITKPG